MPKRAIRRHHIKRLKNKRKKYMIIVDWHDMLSIEEMEQRISAAVRTPKPCSCHMCGNPRTHWKEKPIREQRHLQEKIE
jgi:hypothetical protein